MTVTEPRSENVAKLPALRGGGDMLADPAAFDHMQRVAKMFASAALVPDHLRGKVADCFIALHIAREMREHPVVVMQNIYFVGGRAGWKAEYMIARANKSGQFKGPIRWRVEGEGAELRVTAYAKLADGGDEVSATTGMAMAQAEGWTKNPKYKSMPEHMLRWRSATMLIRLYAPEVMLGYNTADELEDMRAAGQLVPQPDGSYAAPPRPSRGDYQAEHPGLTPEPGEAAEPEQASSTPLVDHVGEIVGEHAPDAWFEEFFAAIGDKKVDRAQRAQMLRNNLDAGATLWLQVHGKSGGFYAELGRAGFTHDDYSEPKEPAGETPPSSAAPEAGAAVEPSAAPAESYRLVDDTGAVLQTDGTAESYVRAMGGMIDFPGLAQDAKAKIWRDNWPETQRIVALGDEAMNETLRAIQAACVGKPKGIAAQAQPGKLV